MSTARYLRTRVEPVPRTLAVAAGDAAAILVFVTAGQFSHAADPIGNPEIVVAAAAPFLLAWGLVAFLGGLYTRGAQVSPRRALSWTVPAWVAATLLGHAIRATGPVPGGTAVEFVLVTLVIGGALVVSWRLLAALLVARW